MLKIKDNAMYAIEASGEEATMPITDDMLMLPISYENSPEKISAAFIIHEDNIRRSEEGKVAINIDAIVDAYEIFIMLAKPPEMVQALLQGHLLFLANERGTDGWPSAYTVEQEALAILRGAEDENS